MGKISLLSMFAAIVVHISAFAQVTEVVCYYQVIGGGKLSPQDLMDLRYKYGIAVIGWSGTKKAPTLFGLGPERTSEFTYTVQRTTVGRQDYPKTDNAEVMREMRMDFDRFGVNDPKVTFMGCKTTALEP